MHYVEHLSKDRKFRKLLENAVPFEVKRRRNIYNYLCASIMSQQLSTKVATVIYNRFLALYDGKE
ncbi:MAG: DNA-3-methyladenine glycosylase 2 family protein, partial [Chitinophagaceae bacterium]